MKKTRPNLILKLLQTQTLGTVCERMAWGVDVLKAHFSHRPCQYSRWNNAIKRIPQYHYQSALLQTWGKNSIMVGSPSAMKPACSEPTVSGNLQYVLQVSSLNEEKMLRTSASTTQRLLYVLCPPHVLKNESMNILPCIVVFVGSENRGMSRR